MSRGSVAQPDAELQIEYMLEVMCHESSYVSGSYNCSELGIYAGWVAHEGSFAASQVFGDRQKRVSLLFAGECFLDSGISALLRRGNHTNDSEPGEWLVPLYLETGDKFFKQLNGLFSGLLVDYTRRTAILFNDRYGIERVYWHENENGFYFASEAKALLRVLPDLRQFDREGIIDHLKYGGPINSRTLFKGIESLPPGSLWRFEAGDCKRSKYFDFHEWEGESAYSASEFKVQFEETFTRILPRYFQGSESIGISLTAGLDGRIIMACLPHDGLALVCYTFAGKAQNLLDAQIASKVANACDLQHHVLQLGPDFFENFPFHFDRTVYVTDGSLGLLGTHEAYFNRKARQLALIRLTGVFGGEIFREVSFYKPLRLNLDLLNPDLRGLWEDAEREYGPEKRHSVTAAVTEEIPWRRFGMVAAGRSQTVFRTPYLDNELVALAYRIPPALRGSPEPVIDAINNNNEKLVRIATDLGFLGQGGMLSSGRRIFERCSFKLDYYYTEGLPGFFRHFNSLLNLFEIGEASFGRHKFLQYRRWFKRELAHFVDEKIREMAARDSKLWNSRYLRGLLKADAKSKVNYPKEINIILTLEAVERLFFRGFGMENNGIDRPLSGSFEQPTLRV